MKCKPQNCNANPITFLFFAIFMLKFSAIFYPFSLLWLGLLIIVIIKQSTANLINALRRPLTCPSWLIAAFKPNLGLSSPRTPDQRAVDWLYEKLRTVCVCIEVCAWHGRSRTHTHEDRDGGIWCSSAQNQYANMAYARAVSVSAPNSIPRLTPFHPAAAAHPASKEGASPGCAPWEKSIRPEGQRRPKAVAQINPLAPAPP